MSLSRTRLFLLGLAIWPGFGLVDVTLASPADELAAEAALFCTKTPAGRRYPSLKSCMGNQLKGMKVVQKAIQLGHNKVSMSCLSGARYEGHTDFAAAGLCVVVKRPELAP